MVCGIRFGSTVAGICLAVSSGMVYAQNAAANLELPTDASIYTKNTASLNLPSFNSSSFLLAANQNDAAVQGQPDMMPATPVPEYSPPWLTGRKAHQYLGLGTLMFAGLTALSSPGEGCEQNCPAVPAARQTSGTTHTRFARTTAVLAVATVITGLIYHWDDFHLEDGFSDPDNQHVMLAGTGALLMLYAINKSAKSSVPTSHAGLAELGAASMLVAVKLTW
jgi:hypothetical protein